MNAAYRFLIDQLGVPLIHRVGSLVAAWLATQGVTADNIATIEGAITIVGGLAVDFIVRKVI
jgi:hypothetical protein